MRVRRVENGDVPFGRAQAAFARGGEAAMQLCKMNLEQWQGEGEDDTHGMPWQRLNSRVDASIVAAYVRDAVLHTDGVDAISAFSFSLDRNTRRFNLTASVKTVDGFTSSFSGVYP